MSIVSVIVPAYNVAEWLDRCLTSVTAQTHADLDIILVDDGSTDGTAAICDVWSQRDPRIRVIHQTNGGISRARNKGLEVMVGDFVTFVDSDDWIHPDMIRTLLTGPADPGTTIAVANFLRTSGPVAEPSERGNRTASLTREEALSRLLGSEHILMTISCGKLFPRSIIDHLRFPEGRLHEDEFMAHQFLLAADRVTIHYAPLYYYFSRESSIMAGAYTAQRGRDSIDSERRRAVDIAHYGLTHLAAVAWARLVRRMIKVLCWTSQAGQKESQHALALELREVLHDPRSRHLPIGLRVLADLATGAPGLACSLLELRQKLTPR